MSKTIEPKICGDCVNMRPEDGYCGRQTAYVNYFDEAPGACFVSRTEVEEFISSAPKPNKLKKDKKEVKLQPDGRPKFRGRHGYDLPADQKYCARCGRVLPRTAFGSCKAKYDGLASWCKECSNAAARESHVKKKAEFERLKAAESAVSAVSAKPAAAEKTEKPAPSVQKVVEYVPAPLSQWGDESLVEELRRRGWKVTCTKEI